MTAHAHIDHVDAAHSGHGEDPRLAAALALKFEPSELHEFEMADKAAGQMMGKLLAFLFCVLVVLMAGVNIWMIDNKSKGNDPQAPVGGSAHPAAHAAAAAPHAKH
ncbi:hypothetical protein [Schlesneria paludicola]|uniref:hypothetical protein n=1 Tax=Schlesneria paludicola TaxID=360056 RepID=UPI00029A5E60|nr:hypothetical protein [Schlesneria paludicola]